MRSEYLKTNTHTQLLSITSVHECHYCQGKYLNSSDSWNKLDLQSCVLQKKIDGSFAG